MRIKNRLFKTYLDAVSRLTTEPCIEINAAGITTVAVDPAHVAIVKAHIPKSADLEITEELRASIDADKTKKYLSSFGPNDTLEISFDDGKMTISSGGMKFKSGLLEESQFPKVPNLTLPSCGTISVKDLKSVRKASISDNIRFSVSGNSFIVLAQNDSDEIEVQNGTECAKDAKATYPADYVSNALMGENLKIEFGNDLPCRIFPDVEGMELMFLVAPRIEND